MKRKASLSIGFCFGERYAEGLCVRNGAKVSGWIVDSQKFRKIDFQWKNCSTELRLYSIKSQLCATTLSLKVSSITGFLRLIVGSEISEAGVYCVHACELWRQVCRIVYLLDFVKMFCEWRLDEDLGERFCSRLWTDSDLSSLSLSLFDVIHVFTSEMQVNRSRRRRIIFIKKYVDCGIVSVGQLLGPNA